MISYLYLTFVVYNSVTSAVYKRTIMKRRKMKLVIIKLFELSYYEGTFTPNVNLSYDLEGNNIICMSSYEVKLTQT